MVDSDPPAAGDAPRRQALRTAMSLAVVVAVFVGVLPRVADLSEVWATVADMTGLELTSALAVAGWNLVSYWLVQVSVLPGLRPWQAAVASQSSTALANSVPAGAAAGIGLSYAIYSSWGFPRSAVTLSLLLSGIWNTFAKVGMPLLALALLVVQGDATAALVMAALAGVGMIVVAVAVFGLLLRSDPLARRIGLSLGTLASRLRRLAGRPAVGDWGEAAVRFRTQTIDVLRARWLALTASTVVSHLSLYLVLLVVLRHVGVAATEVTWAEALGAFAFVRLLSALPITPGGLGVVELGLTAALAVAGGDREAVVAAVLVYRALTYLLPIPLGALTYLVWRRRASWKHPTEMAGVGP